MSATSRLRARQRFECRRPRGGSPAGGQRDTTGGGATLIAAKRISTARYITAFGRVIYQVTHRECSFKVMG